MLESVHATSSLGVGRSRVVAHLLHVFGGDVEGDGDKTLRTNSCYCRTNTTERDFSLFVISNTK